MYWLRRLLRLLTRRLGFDYSPSKALYKSMRDAFDGIPDFVREEKASLKGKR